MSLAAAAAGRLHPDRDDRSCPVFSSKVAERGWAKRLEQVGGSAPAKCGERRESCGERAEAGRPTTYLLLMFGYWMSMMMFASLTRRTSSTSIEPAPVKACAPDSAPDIASKATLACARACTVMVCTPTPTSAFAKLNALASSVLRISSSSSGVVHVTTPPAPAVQLRPANLALSVWMRSQ